MHLFILFIAVIPIILIFPFNVALSNIDDSKPYGIFGGMIGGAVVSKYDLTSKPDITPGRIFKKELGTTSPYRDTFGNSRSFSPEKYFSSEKWIKAEKELLKKYGDNQRTRSYIKYQKYLYAKHYRIETHARAKYSKVIGDVSEKMMDNFYRRGGWEKIHSQIGTQGIDGLYVKRDRNGVIRDVIVAESKAESSKIGTTKKHGTQTSKTYNAHNIKRVITQINTQLKTAQSTGDKVNIRNLKAQLKDLKTIEKFIKNDSYRRQLFHYSSKFPYVEISITNIHSKGQMDAIPDTKPQRTLKILIKDVETGKFGGYTKQHAAAFRQSLIENGLSPERSDRLINKLNKKIESGQLKTGRDQAQYINRQLRAEQTLQDRSTSKLGNPPQKTSLPKLRQHAFGYGSAVGMGAAIGGITSAIMQYAIMGKVDWKQTSQGSVAGGGFTVASKFSERGTTVLFNKMGNSKLIQNSVGKMVTTNFFKTAGRYAPFGVGAVLTIGFSAYSYQSGRLNAIEAAQETGIGLTMLGTFLINPILGTTCTLGAIGYGIYDQLYENNRLLAEQHEFALAEAKHDKKKSLQERQKLIEKGKELRINAWNSLAYLNS